jgi:hypothetical protein
MSLYKVFAPERSVLILQMALAMGIKAVSQHSPIKPTYWFSWTWCVGKVIAYYFRLCLYLSFTSVHPLSQFLLYIFLFSPFDKAGLRY